MAKKPLILVTNDDGINAPGLRTLIEVLNTIGDIVVVAPDSPQSGMGHAITLDSTLFVERVIVDNEKQIEYSCSGTPADCVKLGIREVRQKTRSLCFRHQPRLKFFYKRHLFKHYECSYRSRD